MFQSESSGFPDLAILMSCIISKIMQHDMYSLFEDTAECMNCVLKNICRGISLVVQQVRICASIAGGTGSSTGRGTKILHAMQWGQKKKKGNCPYLLRAMNFKMSQFVPRNSNQKTWKELSNTCNRCSLWVQMSIIVMTSPASSWLTLFLIT